MMAAAADAAAAEPPFDVTAEAVAAAAAEADPPALVVDVDVAAEDTAAAAEGTVPEGEDPTRCCVSCCGRSPSRSGSIPGIRK